MGKEVGDHLKITKEGIAVVEVDNYLSKDIETMGRLDVAHEILAPYQQYIPTGGTVVDVGACLGDYTATFSRFVGPEGTVYAFEPHTPALECLIYNMRSYINVYIYGVALGSQSGRANVIRDFHNLGASQLRLDPNGIVEIMTLDHIASAWPPMPLPVMRRLDFLKIDCEGFDPLVLDGGRETIQRFRPVILIEISNWMLAKLNMNMTAEDIYSRLEAMDYQFTRTDGHDGDVLCLPKEKV